VKLVVVIPALNESATIGPVVRSVPERLSGIDEIQIVVVDDGSTDDTGVLAQEAGALVRRHLHNRGVGAAFATGIAAALELGADLIVNMDGDGQFDATDIGDLIAPVLAKQAGFVTCTRFGRPDYVPRMPWVKRQGNVGMTWLVNRITGLKLTDVSCGFRCYSRETALKLNLFGQFTYTQESLIHLAHQGVTITEVPLRVRGVREFGRSRVASNLVVYGVRSLSIILRSLRDHRPLAFFGSLSGGSMALGVVLGTFVFAHWLHTGHTSPFRSVLLGSAAALIVGVVLGVMALLADMMGRIQQTNQSLLFELKRRGRESDDHAGRD